MREVLGKTFLQIYNISNRFVFPELGEQAATLGVRGYF